MKSQQPPESGGASGPRLHIHAIEAGPERSSEGSAVRWTWCYVEPDSGVELFSNETYATSEGAADYARRAYPDVPFADDDKSREVSGDGSD